MTRRLRLRPEARTDVKKCYAWYEAREPGLGQRFKTELRALLDRIESDPETFPLHARRTRRAVLPRFHHVVFYVVESDHVLVTGVFDGRRHPRSWSDRVREPARRLLAGAMLRRGIRLMPNSETRGVARSFGTRTTVSDSDSWSFG